jgi:hypoxanthine-guanine phosphoribosyltransferase
MMSNYFLRRLITKETLVDQTTIEQRNTQVADVLMNRHQKFHSNAILDSCIIFFRTHIPALPFF